mmetsp:Transcript_6835/g.13387  ORF Transcript_6835/g.13387 Transcript_6835/m.13387 type:complete len:246 (-) Transcript_6835:88-825(-)
MRRRVAATRHWERELAGWGVGAGLELVVEGVASFHLPQVVAHHQLPHAELCEDGGRQLCGEVRRLRTQRRRQERGQVWACDSAEEDCDEVAHCLDDVGADAVRHALQLLRRQLPQVRHNRLPLRTLRLPLLHGGHLRAQLLHLPLQLRHVRLGVHLHLLLLPNLERDVALHDRVLGLCRGAALQQRSADGPLQALAVLRVAEHVPRHLHLKEERSKSSLRRCHRRLEGWSVAQASEQRQNGFLHG